MPTLLRTTVLVLLSLQSVATWWPTEAQTDALRHQRLSHSPVRSAEDSSQHFIESAEHNHDYQGELDTLTELCSTLNVLQTTWYDLSRGRWPTSIDWTGAVLNTHLVASLNELSNSGQDGIHDLVNYYFAHTTGYYFGEHAASLRQQAYDDMLWVVLSWLESIKFIKAHTIKYHERAWYGEQYISVFAGRAKSFYNTTTFGWSDDLCEGGMTWNPALEPYKNTITNELFIAASVGMYLYFPDHQNTSLSLASRQQLLVSATHGYDWLVSANMTNKQGLYVDGFHIKGWNKNGTGGTACTDRNEMVYTYNQGVILSGLRGLWEATGNATYLNDGYRLIRRTILSTGWNLTQSRPTTNASWHGLGRKGILEDYCDAAGSCDQNGHTFKSIYFHHLGQFCSPLPVEAFIPGFTFAASAALRKSHARSCKAYGRWVKLNALAALRTRDERGRIGMWWGANESITESAPLPVGAVDYRNGDVHVKDIRYSKRIGEDMTATQKQRQKTSYAGDKDSKSAAQHQISKHDWNDRGRGRTVESHSGGVAVLRCLHQMFVAD
ncbi:hypothetical protein AMS68_003933 [Peltaster fructicola]|uniref:Uncharacterized protein n=1 Tax=Peltaster fructicola TaxID=286661 RepID=A0A6H0XUQ7_9PEZI|nr:hypothetical protein AMS68_003933 [Peltaster fructicola]